jgi:hypothetical protein
MKAKPDETLEEIWEIGYDPRKQVAYYQRKQKESGAKIYRPAVPAETTLHALDILHDRAHAEIAADQCITLTSYRAARKRKARKR